jgi:hypothetical protein
VVRFDSISELCDAPRDRRACEETDNLDMRETYQDGNRERIKASPRSLEAHFQVTTESRTSVEEDLLIRGCSLHDDTGLL